MRDIQVLELISSASTPIIADNTAGADNPSQSTGKNVTIRDTIKTIVGKESGRS